MLSTQSASNPARVPIGRRPTPANFRSASVVESVAWRLGAGFPRARVQTPKPIQTKECSLHVMIWACAKKSRIPTDHVLATNICVLSKWTQWLGSFWLPFLETTQTRGLGGAGSIQGWNCPLLMLIPHLSANVSKLSLRK